MKESTYQSSSQKRDRADVSNTVEAVQKTSIPGSNVSVAPPSTPTRKEKSLEQGSLIDW